MTNLTFIMNPPGHLRQIVYRTHRAGHSLFDESLVWMSYHQDIQPASRDNSDQAMSVKSMSNSWIRLFVCWTTVSAEGSGVTSSSTCLRSLHLYVLQKRG